MEKIITFTVASLPIIWLVIALKGLRLSGGKAGLGALLISGVLSILKWDMTLVEVLTAALEGGVFAIWPIGIIIIAAIFNYNINAYTGAMDIIQRMMTGVTEDKRILTLIIGWCFAGFMEGIAGFGTAVAIPAGMLWSLGINPISATVACLVSNSMVTAFGSIGTTTLSLAQVTGLQINQLSMATVVQMSPIMMLIPFIMVIIVGGGIKSLKGIGHIILVSGLSFIMPQYLIAKYLGAEMIIVVGSLFSLLLTILLVKRDKKETPEEYRIEVNKTGKELEEIDLNKAVISWISYILIFFLLIFTSKLVPSIRNVLSEIKSTITIYSGSNPEVLTFEWLISPGILVFISAIIGGLVQGASISDLVKLLVVSIKQMSNTVITILFVLATAKVMGYSGMISTIAIIMVSTTGKLFPIISPVIGGLGGFVTGSGASSNILFGKMQVEAAESIGSNPHWLAAMNTIGAGIGKTMSPQSIAIGVSTTGLVGEEGEILKRVLKWVIIKLVLACIISVFFNMYYIK